MTTKDIIKNCLDNIKKGNFLKSFPADTILSLIKDKIMLKDFYSSLTELEKEEEIGLELDIHCPNCKRVAVVVTSKPKSKIKCRACEEEFGYDSKLVGINIIIPSNEEQRKIA